MLSLPAFLPPGKTREGRTHYAPADDPPFDPLECACDWCGGRGCLPTNGPDLLPCPECDPHGRLREDRP